MLLDFSQQKNKIIDCFLNIHKCKENVKTRSITNSVRFLTYSYRYSCT